MSGIVTTLFDRTDRTNFMTLMHHSEQVLDFFYSMRERCIEFLGHSDLNSLCLTTSTRAAAVRFCFGGQRRRHQLSELKPHLILKGVVVTARQCCDLSVALDGVG